MRTGLVCLRNHSYVDGQERLIDLNAHPGPITPQVLREVEDEIASAFRAYPYLNDNQASDFQRGIMISNQDAVVTLLVTLLPNLHCMETHNCLSHFLPWLDRMFNNISANHLYETQGQNFDNGAESGPHKNEEYESSMEPDAAAMVKKRE